eukprot:PhM_4_TR3253/c0_g1_i1/m.2895
MDDASSESSSAGSYEHAWANSQVYLDAKRLLQQQQRLTDQDRQQQQQQPTTTDDDHELVCSQWSMRASSSSPQRRQQQQQQQQQPPRPVGRKPSPPRPPVARGRSRSPYTTMPTDYTREAVAELYRHIQVLEARNDALHTELLQKTAELARQDVKSNEVVLEYTDTMKRFEATRAQDRRDRRLLEEDRARLHQQVIALQDNNRAQQQDYQRVNKALRAALRDKERFIHHGADESARIQEVLSAKDKMLDDLERRNAQLSNENAQLHHQHEALRSELVELRRSKSTSDDEVCMLTARLAARASEEPEAMEKRLEERRIMEDTIHVLSMNMRRLMIILTSEPPKGGWHRHVVQSAMADEFVYVGDVFLDVSESNNDYNNYENNNNLVTTPRRGASSPRHARQQKELQDVVAGYRACQNRVSLYHHHAGKEAKAQFHGNCRQFLHDRPVEASEERLYWIPRAAFDVMSRFVATHYPTAPYTRFYQLFIDLNVIWKEKLERKFSAEVSMRVRKALEDAAKKHNLPQQQPKHVVVHQQQPSSNQPDDDFVAAATRVHSEMVGHSKLFKSNSGLKNNAGNNPSASVIWTKAAQCIGELVSRVLQLKAEVKEYRQQQKSNNAKAPTTSSSSSSTAPQQLTYLRQRVRGLVTAYHTDVMDTMDDNLALLEPFDGEGDDAEVKKNEDLRNLRDLQMDFVAHLKEAATQLQIDMLDALQRSETVYPAKLEYF